jgi:hypothetical protein
MVRAVPREMPALDAYCQLHRAEGTSRRDQHEQPKDRPAPCAAYAFPQLVLKLREGYSRIWRLPLTFVIDRRGVLRKDGWYGDPCSTWRPSGRQSTPLRERG